MKPDFAVVVPEKICRLCPFTETEAETRSGGGGGRAGHGGLNTASSVPEPTGFWSSSSIPILSAAT